MKRFWEPKLATWQVCVLPGELYTTREDEVVTTVLGSCVSTCVRDTARNVGGMNHFLLPHAPSTLPDSGAAARYGVYALECLINAVLRGGGKREMLEVKVFGGGRVLEGAGDIGRTNIDFVHRFLATEHIAIAAEDVGGSVARRLRYWPRSGRVQCMHMPMTKATDVVATERAAAARVAPDAAKQIAAEAGSIELF